MAIKRTLQSPALICSPENLKYFAGYSGEGYLLLAGDNSVILTDFRYVEQARLETGLDVLMYSRGGETELLKSTVNKLGLKKLGFEAGYITFDRFAGLSKLGVELVSADKEIAARRSVKDAEEIEAIRECAKIQDAAFEHIKGCIKAGVTERDVAAELEYFMRKNGGDGAAFDTIVASGENGSRPHAGVSDRVIRPGDMVTMDYGCRKNGYLADITRTVCVEAVEKELEIVYNIVLKAQLMALDAVRAGMVCSVVDAVARDYIAKEGYGERFGHGLGHSLGLRIHEEPRFTPTDDTVLKSGVVITVEPGIYIEGRFGVRIEDTVLVTDNGCERLTVSDKALCVVG